MGSSRLNIYIHQLGKLGSVRPSKKKFYDSIEEIVIFTNAFLACINKQLYEKKWFIYFQTFRRKGIFRISNYQHITHNGPTTSINVHLHPWNFRLPSHLHPNCQPCYRAWRGVHRPSPNQRVQPDDAGRPQDIVVHDGESANVIQTDSIGGHEE